MISFADFFGQIPEREGSISPVSFHGCLINFIKNMLFQGFESQAFFQIKFSITVHLYLLEKLFYAQNKFWSFYVLKPHAESAVY